MSKMVLATGVNLQGQLFIIDHTEGRLDPGIARKANSMSISNFGFKPPVIVYDGDNFGGQALVLTSWGGINDLSKTPWGNWANRIASIRMADAMHKLEADAPSGTIHHEAAPPHILALSGEHPCDQHDGCTDFQSSVWSSVTCVCGHDTSHHGLPFAEHGPVIGSFEARWERTTRDMSEADQAALKRALQAAQNPMGDVKIKAGVHPLSCGGGRVRQGQTTILGAATCGELLHFNVSGPATVQLQLWWPFAMMPCGIWVIGSGGSTIGVGCNQGGACYAGQPGGTIKAYGIAGEAIVTYST